MRMDKDHKEFISALFHPEKRRALKERLIRRRTLFRIFAVLMLLSSPVLTVIGALELLIFLTITCFGALWMTQSKLDHLDGD